MKKSHAEFIYHWLTEAPKTATAYGLSFSFAEIKEACQILGKGLPSWMQEIEKVVDQQSGDLPFDLRAVHKLARESRRAMDDMARRILIGWEE